MTSDSLENDLRRQSEAARDLVSALRSDGHDEETVADMAEGETSLIEAIAAALTEIDECDMMSVGIAAKIEEFRARKGRVDGRAERVRGLIEQALVVAQIETVKLPSATLTVKRIPPKPVVIDEADIPTEFWRQPEPVLDKTAINAAVKEGRIIAGVSMSNGGTSLQIRRA